MFIYIVYNNILHLTSNIMHNMWYTLYKQYIFISLLLKNLLTPCFLVIRQVNIMFPVTLKL